MVRLGISLSQENARKALELRECYFWESPQLPHHRRCELERKLVIIRLQTGATGFDRSF